MPRTILDEASIHPAARPTIAQWNHEIVDEVRATVRANDVVIVGMGQNPFPGKARKALDAIGQAHKYLGYGSYFSMWRPRCALKMWAGWPTFPMVFVKGTLVGGYTDLQALIDNGELKTMLAGPARM
jgi:monothiol glutaredoxin